MNLVVELWAKSEIPAYGGLFRADGTVREVFFDGPGSLHLELGEPFEVGEPKYEHEIDVDGEAELPDGRGFVCCGPRGARATRASSPGSTGGVGWCGW